MFSFQTHAVARKAQREKFIQCKSTKFKNPPAIRFILKLVCRLDPAGRGSSFITLSIKPESR